MQISECDLHFGVCIYFLKSVHILGEIILKKQIISALILTLILTQTSCRGTDFFAYQKNNTDAPVTEAPQAVDT